MIQKIARLPEEVINKIAAGEVVENPASIAKELIENSLDAGAFRIDLWMEEGGARLLKIEDDGCGMGQSDALLSLERHATSKIRSEQDLFSLVTMGFRGEALAAIASVSRLEMRTSDGEGGTRIASLGGKIEGVEPCARNRGTTIVVEDLFFNTAARKKFMKSSSANAASLLRVVETIALAHPDKTFTLTSEGKSVLALVPQDPKKRIEALLSPMPHELKASGIWGWLSPPEESKTHRKGQYLFINQRPVFSPLISKAVKSGYGTMIAEKDYPSFVLFLEVALDRIDVNVHPQKKEVRFSEEGKIFRLVEQAVASALLSPSPSFSRPLSFSSFSLAEPPPAIYDFRPSPVQPSFDFGSAMRPLAIIEGYFFLQTDDLLLIALQRAHARVLYESLKERKAAVQHLMWPLEIAIEEEEIPEELQAMGIDCRLIGKRMLAVDALPSWIEAEDFPEFYDAWRSGKKLEAAACRVGMRRKFSLDEALLLWGQLLKCRETVYDPAGRRIWEKLDGERLKTILERR